MRRNRNYLIESLIVGLAYYLGARVGFLLAIPPGNVTPVWPSAGIAVAALLLRGYRVLPAVWVAATMAHLSGLTATAYPPAVSMAYALFPSALIGLGITLKALTAGYLLRRFTSIVPVITSVRDAFIFVLVSVVTTALVPLVGMTTLLLSGLLSNADYGSVWFIWWLGEATGVIVFAPFTLAWFKRPPLMPTERHVLHFLIFLVVVLMVDNFIFLSGAITSGYPILFALIPFLIYGAFFFEQQGVMNFMIITAVVSLLGVLRGRGPVAGEPFVVQILLQQAFLSVYTITGLVLAASFEERKILISGLRQLNQELEERVRQRTAELRRRSRELEATFDSMTEAIAIYDLEGRVSLSNRRFRQLLGYSKDDLQKSIEERIANFESMRNPDGTPLAHEQHPVVRALKFQETVVGQVIRARYIDGTEKILLNNEAPIIADGVQIGAVVVVADITERTKAEEELKKYQLFFEHSRDVMLMVGMDGKILQVNAAGEAVYGYSRDELCRRTVFDLRAEDAADHVREQLLKANAGGILFEVRHIRRDGTQFDVQVSSTGIDIGGKRVLLSIVRDITERKRDEAALRESEARFRALLTASADAVYRASPDWRVMRQVYGRQFVADMEEPNRNWLHGYIPPEDHSYVWSVIQEAIRTRSTFELEHRIIRADGSIGWSFSRAVPLVSDSGEITEWFGYASDITARKQAEEALRESEARYSALYNQMTEGLVIFDPQGNLVDMNPAALAIHGFENVNMLRRHLETLTDVFHIYDLQGSLLPPGQWPIGRVLRGETFDSYEVRVVRPDTGRTWIGSYGGTPVYDQEGNLILAIVTLRDVTRSKEIEAALQESETLFRALTENSPDIIARFDRELRHIYINPYGARVYNITQDQIIGRTSSDLGMPADKVALWKEHLEKVFTSRAQQTVAYDFDNPVMGTRHYYTTFVPEKDEEGNVRSALAITRDITELKRTEKELQHLATTLEQRVDERTAQIRVTNEELESVIYSMSHDLFSPLRGISGYAGLLDEKREHGIWDEEAKEQIDRIHAVTNRMKQMVRSVRYLLGLFRKEYVSENVNLSDMVRRIAEERRQKYPARRGKFVIPADICACTDRETIEITLRALIDNAWKYTAMKDYYRIEFGVQQQESGEVYYIRDNGRGFDNRYADQLFRPFYLLDAYPTGEAGYGMGLTVVHAIIRKQLGRIWAEGEEGKGATFYFTLRGREECPET